MVSAIGPSGLTRAIDSLRSETAARAKAAAKATTSDTTTEATPATPAAQLAALGAPIDTDRVTRLRQAISDGSYAIDSRAIADRMIAADLPAA